MSNAKINKKQELQQYINKDEIQKRVSQLLGNNENKKDKFLASLIKVGLDENLLNCSTPSIINSALTLAELDLPLTKNLGQTYIVKYGKEAEAVIGYKGYLQLAERSGKSVKTNPVYKCDKFEMSSDGFNDFITFKPNLDERQDWDNKWVSENIKGVLVAVKDNSTGNITSQFVSNGKIEQIAGMSKAKNPQYSPHHQWTIEMKMAKAIKYVLAKTPMSDVVARAIEIDNQLDIKRLQDSPFGTTPILPKLSQEIFNEKKEEWQQAINNGTSADNLIVMLESKYEVPLPTKFLVDIKKMEVVESAEIVENGVENENN
jgi:phage RecT family recombinase